MKALERRLQHRLAQAGIRIGGDRPDDLQVTHPGFYRRAMVDGSLGIGEAYMDGWWECEALDQMVYRALHAGLLGQLESAWEPLRALVAGLLNLQWGARAFKVGRQHYDLGDDLFVRMLDRRMIYSCGYWADADDLDAAQEAKLDLICRKLMLEPGMRVLDIGCGWGGAARFAAERFGVEVVGITISEQQAQAARLVTRDLPIEIRLQDYKELDEPFDRIFSVGMFEHVGYKNYRTFMRTVRRCLPADGLAVLHTIGGLHSTNRTDPWIDKYIFPNSMIPSAAQITAAAEGQLIIEDWQNFGPDYDRTLMCWYENFERHWPELSRHYDERFRRMWRFYLLSCAGSFRARYNQVWQIVLSGDGRATAYRPAGVR
jgi:cyclopropane-fatty-acyl-phospholipid synthase